MQFEVLTIGVPTINGRIYPHSVIKKAVEKYSQEILAENRAFVFLLQDNGYPDLNKVAGIVSDIKIDGDKVICEIHLLATPAGNSIKSDFDSGKLFVRTGGTGVVSNKTVTDYELTGMLFTDTE